MLTMAPKIGWSPQQVYGLDLWWGETLSSPQRPQAFLYQKGYPDKAP
jgi:hypothetical protein